MIKQKELTLLKDSGIPRIDLKFPKGSEFGIINGIVHMNGYLVQGNLQKVIYDWLVDNMSNKTMFK